MEFKVRTVGSQIILSQILAIQNNNHAQEHKIYVENPFSLKGKTPNNFTIIKSITIILVYVSWLKKNLSYFSLLSHTHTNYLFQRQQHFALSSLAIFSKAANPLLSPPWLSSWRRQYLALSFLLRSSQTKIYFLSLGFTLYFLSCHRNDPWAKAIKFFIALFIYKTLLLFLLGLGICYLFNKESIPSWTRNILPL